MYICTYIRIYTRSTESIMHIPFRVARFQEIILLIIQNKYLNVVRRIDAPRSDPPHKIMR